MANTHNPSLQVHTAIEACLKRNMTKEATCTVLQRFGVDPAFTRLGECTADRHTRSSPYPQLKPVSKSKFLPFFLPECGNDTDYWAIDSLPLTPPLTELIPPALQCGKD